MAQCQPRNRLCVTFEMDHELAGHDPNGHQNRRDSINKREQRFCLNENQGINRRHSSELRSTSVLPKVSISRANSDILLNRITNGDNNIEEKRNFETKRTNAMLKKLASYINVKPRLNFHEHDYQRMTNVLNIKSNKCRICSGSIYFNCYECIRCKLNGHKKCLQNLYVKCPNKIMPPRLTVFGLEISDDNQISEVLSTCIMEIEKRPIHKLRGIYKVDGDSAVIENLCLSFEFGSHLIDLSQISPHDIAGVIKEYLNRISTPIFNQSLQKELITIGREWPVRKVPYTQSGIAILIFELRRLIGCLAAAHRNNLAYLIYHLKRIVDRQNITEMTANSLGIVFASIIFRNESSNRSGSQSMMMNNGRVYYDNNKNNNNDIDRNSMMSTEKNQFEFKNPNNINNNIDNNNNNTADTMNGVQILLDVTLKIRVIELMIYHANDIFSNLE